MEERKWEDLEMDCLVNVLGRVGMESRLLDVPFVCKSWHKASLSPLCWKTLVFPKNACDEFDDSDLIDRFMDRYGINKLLFTAFIKFIIDRSCRNASLLQLPNDCTEEAFKYAVDECPALKILILPPYSCIRQSSIIELIGRWKNLEGLRLECSINLTEILAQISLNCKNFRAFFKSGAYIGEEEASAIVNFLPKIKYLYLRRASMNQENLVTIIQGCKELVHLDVSDSIGFEVDDKILELASHITTFKHEGSRLFDDDCDYDYGICTADVYDDYVSD